MVLERGELLHMPVSKSLSGVHRGLHELRFTDHTGSYRVLPGVLLCSNERRTLHVARV